MPINYSEYPPDWFSRIRPAVLSRANGCCEECGARNKTVISRDRHGYPREICGTEWDWVHQFARQYNTTIGCALRYYKFTRIILTIAHLDHDKENHSVQLERLKALCQRCHLNYDRRRHTENRRNGREWRKDQYSLNFVPE